jgi:two-component system LytT family response regulator
MIKVCDIKAITADGDYSFIHVKNNKKHIFIKSLKEWETILPKENFIRIHRSTIINLGQIKQIEKWFSNTCRIYLNDIDHHFKMSQRYTASFKKKYIP